MEKYETLLRSLKLNNIRDQKNISMDYETIFYNSNYIYEIFKDSLSYLIDYYYIIVDKIQYNLEYFDNDDICMKAFFEETIRIHKKIGLVLNTIIEIINIFHELLNCIIINSIGGNNNILFQLRKLRSRLKHISRYFSNRRERMEFSNFNQIMSSTEKKVNGYHLIFYKMLNDIWSNQHDYIQVIGYKLTNNIYEKLNSIQNALGKNNGNFIKANFYTFLMNNIRFNIRDSTEGCISVMNLIDTFKHEMAVFVPNKEIKNDNIHKNMRECEICRLEYFVDNFRKWKCKCEFGKNEYVNCIRMACVNCITRLNSCPYCRSNIQIIN